MSKNRYRASPTRVCTEESTGASSSDEDDIDMLQQAVCRKALRKLSMGSSVISEGRSILDDGFNRVVPAGKLASEYTYRPLFIYACTCYFFLIGNHFYPLQISRKALNWVADALATLEK